MNFVNIFLSKMCSIFISNDPELSCAPFHKSLFDSLGLPIRETQNKIFAVDRLSQSIDVHLDMTERRILYKTAGHDRQPLILGRQSDLWETLGTKWQITGSKPDACIKAAAVTAVINSDGAILLTRRAQNMRTFPGCWVLPGGMLDEGESFQHAAAREVEEETGLHVNPNELRAIAAWESSYPTTPAHCAEAGGIASHVLMVCFAGPIAGGALRLQPDETDAAVWVHPDDLRALLSSDTADPAAPSTQGWLECAAGEPPGGRVELQRLAGVYPNGSGEGVGLGHSFVLGALLRGSGPA